MASDPTKLKKTREVGRQTILFGLARAADSARLYCGASDGSVVQCDLATEKSEPVSRPAHESYVTCVALAGPYVVSGSYDGKLVWYHEAEAKQTRSAEAHSRWIRGLAATPDGKILASVGDDMQCHLWNAETGEKLRTLSNHESLTPHHFPSMLYAVAISPDGKLVATGDRVGHVVVSDIASGKKLAELEAPIMYTWDPTARRHSIGGIRSLAFSPDNTQLAVGGMGKVGNIDHLEGLIRVEVFNWKDGGKPVYEYSADKTKGLVESLAFHPSGDWLLAAGGAGNGFFHFLDVKNKKLLHAMEVQNHVHAVALNEPGDTVYATCFRSLMAWEMKD